MVTSRKKYSLIAGNPLELYVLTDSGNMYRGQANHSDIVKSIKIGQSAAKPLPELDRARKQTVQRLSLGPDGQQEYGSSERVRFP